MKKIYCKPNVEAYQINASNIICNSPKMSMGDTSNKNDAPSSSTNDNFRLNGIWSE